MPTKFERDSKLIDQHEYSLKKIAVAGDGLNVDPDNRLYHMTTFIVEMQNVFGDHYVYKSRGDTTDLLLDAMGKTLSDVKKYLPFCNEADVINAIPTLLAHKRKIKFGYTPAEGKYLRITCYDWSKLKEQEKMKIRCLDCKKEFFDENEWYDHVMSSYENGIHKQV